MNVTKIILNKCQIFHLKCSKFNFGWGSALTPLEKLVAFPRTQLGLGGREKGEEKMEGKGGEGNRGKVGVKMRGRERKGGKWREKQG